MLRLYLIKSISWSRAVWSIQNSANNSSHKISRVNAFQCYDKLEQPLHMLVQSSCSSLTCQKYYSTEKQLSEADYESLADETLDSLTEMFEDLPEKFELDPEYDVTYNSGVLTVKISSSWGTYVINKQTPNKQIWFSSPKSGPKRFDYVDGIWIYKHDQSVLHELLNKEVSEAVGLELDFTGCSYGKSTGVATLIFICDKGCLAPPICLK